LLLLLLLLQLLPDRLVSPGVRNLVPLALLTVGIALWGVAAGAIHDRFADRPSEGWWRQTLEVRVKVQGRFTCHSFSIRLAVLDEVGWCVSGVSERGACV